MYIKLLLARLVGRTRIINLMANENTRKQIEELTLLLRSQKLSDRMMNPVTMYLLIESYLERLPGAMKEIVRPGGSTTSHCTYTQLDVGCRWPTS